MAYLGFIHLLVAHSHPVMLMFCQLLINRNKERQYERSVEEGKQCTFILVMGNVTAGCGPQFKKKKKRKKLLADATQC